MPVSVGELFAGFTILRVLGAGAMGRCIWRPIRGYRAKTR